MRLLVCVFVGLFVVVLSSPLHHRTTSCSEKGDCEFPVVKQLTLDVCGEGLPECEGTRRCENNAGKECNNDDDLICLCGTVQGSQGCQKNSDCHSGEACFKFNEEAKPGCTSRQAIIDLTGLTASQLDQQGQDAPVVAPPPPTPGPEEDDGTLLDETEPDQDEQDEQKPVEEEQDEQKPDQEAQDEQKPDQEAQDEQKPDQEAQGEQKPDQEAQGEQKPDQEAQEEQEPLEEISEDDPEPSVSAEAVDTDDDSGEEPLICIDVRALSHLSPDDLVYPTHNFASVKCDNNGSCATPGHMVTYNGIAMMMRTYCDTFTTCTDERMRVNSPRYQLQRRIKSKTQGLQYTAFAARYATRMEEMMLRTAVRVGL